MQAFYKKMKAILSYCIICGQEQIDVYKEREGRRSGSKQARKELKERNVGEEGAVEGKKGKKVRWKEGEKEEEEGKDRKKERMDEGEKEGMEKAVKEKKEQGKWTEEKDGKKKLSSWKDGPKKRREGKKVRQRQGKEISKSERRQE